MFFFSARDIYIYCVKYTAKNTQKDKLQETVWRFVELMWKASGILMRFEL